MCQFSVKMDNFELFNQNLGKLSNYVQYFGSNNVVGVAESWVEAEMSWVEVGAWFSNTYFFNLKKNIIWFSRYLEFCAFVKSTDFKICGVIIGIASSGISTYAYFFLILSTLKKKFVQMLVCCKTNISNMFLALDWKLETSSRLFYFIKMTI